MTYWRTSGDGKGRFYAQGPAAQRLPKELRILLFGRMHIEIDIIGAFYEIIRRTASRLKETGDSSTLPVLPSIEQARQLVEHELLRQRPQSHAAPVAKRLIHIAINASVTITAKFVTDSQYTFTPPLATLSTDIHQAANAVCHYLSKQPHTHRRDYTTRNRNFYHLESVEATYIYMMHIIQGLQQAQPQCPIVLLHDGLLVSMLPSQSTLTRLHEEALRLAGLQADDTPFLLLTNHRDSYNQLFQQLPPSNPHNLQALSTAIAAVNLSHLHQPPTSKQTLRRSTMPPPNHSSHLRSLFRSHVTTTSKQMTHRCTSGRLSTRDQRLSRNPSRPQTKLSLSGRNEKKQCKPQITQRWPLLAGPSASPSIMVAFVFNLAPLEALPVSQLGLNLCYRQPQVS